MRILFALHGYLPDGKGGTETHVAALAKVLARRHAVRVVAREGDASKPDFAVTKTEVDGIEVVRINNLYAESSSFPLIYKNQRVHEEFERQLVDFRPDLVHIHHLTGLSTTIVETIKAGGLPLVMTLHDFWTVCPRGQRMTKELDLCENVDRNLCFHCLGGIWPQFFSNRAAEPTEVDPRGKLAPSNLAAFDRHLQYILGLVDILVTPSEYHRERMLEFPISTDRIVALPHGLDHGPFRNAAAMRHPRPVKRIGYIGSVIPVKGVHVLMDAFKMLGRADIELHIHGEGFAFHDDTTYVDRLKARSIGQRNIFFEGPYKPADLPRILANLDILVVPSLWWETFCLTIREGLMAGVPVVASDLGAMREALDGEENGLLFRPGDARDLADRLIQLIEDDGLRVKLSQCAHVVKPIDTYAEELLALYDRAMALSGARQGSLVVAPPSFPVKGTGKRTAHLKVRAGDGDVRVSRTDATDGSLKVTLSDRDGRPIGDVVVVAQGDGVDVAWEADPVVPKPRHEKPDGRRGVPAAVVKPAPVAKPARPDAPPRSDVFGSVESNGGGSRAGRRQRKSRRTHRRRDA